MAIGRYIQTGLDGILWIAFQEFCTRTGCTNGREGIQMLIRETPEYKRVEAAMMKIPNDTEKKTKDPKPESVKDSQDNIAAIT